MKKITTLQSVDIKVLDGYLTEKIVELVKLNKKNVPSTNKLYIETFNQFYPLEKMRMDLSLPKIEFNNIELQKLYDIMLREARHYVTFSNESLVR